MIGVGRSPAPVRPELVEGLSFFWSREMEVKKGLRQAQAERGRGSSLLLPGVVE
jgi:hypothetical protein